MGSWGENVMSWVGAREHDREFLLLRYEDLLEDTPREMTRISEFLGLVHISAEQIDKAVELSSAASMRRLEAAQNNHWVTTKESRKDIPFVRSRKVGSVATITPIGFSCGNRDGVGPIMKLLGYALSSELRKSSPRDQNV
jgi:hypothetical protein